jgi:hypothetical protein
MRQSASLFKGVFLPGVLLAFGIPASVFFICALLADLSLADSLRETIAQYAEKRQHLWGCGVLGVIPVALLTFIGWLIGKRLNPQRTRFIAQMGLLGIALVLVWINFQFWPGYLPERAFRGFPHGLEFVIGPIYFAPAAMLACMLIAWLATRNQVDSS